MSLPDACGSSSHPLTRPQGDLERQAREFAAEITGLLNKTVTHGIRLSSKMDRHGSAIVRYWGNSPNGLDDLIPLTISQKPARLGLRILHTLTLDDESKYLRNTQSAYALATADGEAILTYDFVRPAPNVYPEAHLHIDGESASLQRLLDLSGQTERTARRLHLPVGGRRFRPCLEDIIEFCVSEELVDYHAGWEDVLSEARSRFHLRQLKAAVRRCPEAAAEALQEAGWG